jgi:WD40 repeat protein
VDQERHAKITSLAINKQEDCLYVMTDTKQLLYVNNINLDGSENEEFNFQYVSSPFHSSEIRGLDVCLRKQLIVTCSHKMINIWNYQTMKLEISMKPPDDPQAVAFHPSGFHILVAFTDKVSMMNVLSSSIKEYNSVQMKNCKEVRFSNGGHLFAAGGANQGIHVFNFYTAECPPNMQCKGHAVVRGIDWFEDDSGFCSTGGDSAYFYNLAYQREQKSRIVDRDCIIKGCQF